ncbi:MAG TPA: hypothetical protein VFX49_15425 [Chloroflexota bacterium]|nr:hypothetical protein [Chloroflexota bacterium]
MPDEQSRQADPPNAEVVDEALSDADEVDAKDAAEGAEAEEVGEDEGEAESDVESAAGPGGAIAVAPVAAAPEAEALLDLAELGRRYEVSDAFADRLRRGFRELKRQPAAAKRLPALLRGLARAHEPDARRAAEQITQLIERIQAPPKDDA